MDPAQPATMDITQVEARLSASLAKVPCLICVYRILMDDLKDLCTPCLGGTYDSCGCCMKDNCRKINNPTLIPSAQALNKALHT